MDSTTYAEFTVKFYYNQEFKKNVDNIDMYFQEVNLNICCSNYYFQKCYTKKTEETFLNNK